MKRQAKLCTDRQLEDELLSEMQSVLGIVALWVGRTIIDCPEKAAGVEKFLEAKHLFEKALRKTVKQKGG